MNNKRSRRGAHLAELKKQESALTANKLTEALNRFESGNLERLKKGTKLTRLSFATEADVARDTPFSRYRKGLPNAGKYRFPEIVERFNHLRKKSTPKPPPELTSETLAEWNATFSELKAMLSASRLVSNALDAQNVDLRRRTAELEELVSSLSEERDHLNSEVIRLKRQSISEVPATISRR